ncbi:DUF6223 family protein [Nocardia araoensis]|uniref:DUF6223 family protein n=1 Tax=Nocardia araoensis TaxID=228600 RepID=UPI00030EE123|nr:DUF6223 family protein [Nocardia araoensis]
MPIRHLPAAIAAALLGGLAIAAPAAATASTQPLAVATGMTSGRLGPTLTALVGLAAVVLGGRALARSGEHPRDGGRGAVAALVSGLLSSVVGGLFAATADGGPGTGNGIVGSWVAMALGLAAMVLGGLTVARSRRERAAGQ